MVRRVPLFLLLLSLATPAVAADLTPNSGPMQFSAQLLDGGIQIGQFIADAVLAEGNFTGIMSATVGGVTLQGELISSRSYLENGTCLLYAESGRNRLLLRAAHATTASSVDSKEALKGSSKALAPCAAAWLGQSPQRGRQPPFSLSRR